MPRGSGCARYRCRGRPFAEAPKKSIDYAVMEKTSRAAIVEGCFRWSDIGSWDAVYAVSKHNRSANALYGPAIALNARDCLVHA
jgi:mannose-1-phosphate guanylyltransferase/mannose-6-phosphate isomerase